MRHQRGAHELVTQVPPAFDHNIERRAQQVMPRCPPGTRGLGLFCHRAGRVDFSFQHVEAVTERGEASPAPHAQSSDRRLFANGLCRMSGHPAVQAAQPTATSNSLAFPDSMFLSRLNSVEPPWYGPPYPGQSPGKRQAYRRLVSPSEKSRYGVFCLLLDAPQVIFVAEALGIDFVNILGAGRPRGKPSAFGNHLDSAERKAVARSGG